MRETVPSSLKRFIWDIQSMVELAESEREILLIGRDLMARLVAGDDVLPQVFATAGAVPRLYQLYADAMERFTVVACVLGPGQEPPIRREPVWEILGLLRGRMVGRRFALAEDGAPQGEGTASPLGQGAVETVPTTAGVVRRLENAADEVAIAIQVFGGEIGTLPRRTFAADGGWQEQVSGYDNPEDAPGYDILTIQTEIVD